LVHKLTGRPDRRFPGFGSKSKCERGHEKDRKTHVQKKRGWKPHSTQTSQKKANHQGGEGSRRENLVHQGHETFENPVLAPREDKIPNGRRQLPYLAAGNTPTERKGAIVRRFRLPKRRMAGRSKNAKNPLRGLGSEEMYRYQRRIRCARNSCSKTRGKERCPLMLHRATLVSKIMKTTGRTRKRKRNSSIFQERRTRRKRVAKSNGPCFDCKQLVKGRRWGGGKNLDLRGYEISQSHRSSVNRGGDIENELGTRGCT